MRHLSPSFSGMAGIALLAALTVSSTAHSEDVRSGTVKSVQGEVLVLRGESRQPVHSGDGVATRDRIVTGPSSAAALVLRDGTAITVGPNSTVDLTSFQFEPTRQEGGMVIGLIKGSIRFITGFIGKHNPESVRISTLTATAGIRGTDFILEVP